MTDEEKRERWRHNRARWKAANHEKALAVDRASRQRRRDHIREVQKRQKERLRAAGKIAEYSKRHYEKYKAELNRKSREWYYANRARALAKRRQWSENHPGYNRAYRAANKERIAFLIDRWRREHPERSRELSLRSYHKHRASHVQRARIKNAKVTAAAKFLRAIGVMQRGPMNTTAIRRLAAYKFVRELGLL